MTPLLLVMCEQVKLSERQTSPPDYLTEAELITLMEKHGIGTDASISVHINNICERNYVAVQPGRKLKPTALGVVLVHGYQKVCLHFSHLGSTQLFLRLPIGPPYYNNMSMRIQLL